MDRNHTLKDTLYYLQVFEHMTIEWYPILEYTWCMTTKLTEHWFRM